VLQNLRGVEALSRVESEQIQRSPVDVKELVAVFVYHSQLPGQSLHRW